MSHDPEFFVLSHTTSQAPSPTEPARRVTTIPAPRPVPVVAVPRPTSVQPLVPTYSPPPVTEPENDDYLVDLIGAGK